MAAVRNPEKVTLSADDCPPDCQCKVVLCPPECQCKIPSKQDKKRRLIFNAVGIVLAVLATYLIVSTDTKLYIVFWVCYSILRRLMVKSKAHEKSKTA